MVPATRQPATQKTPAKALVVTPRRARVARAHHSDGDPSSPSVRRIRPRVGVVVPSPTSYGARSWSNGGNGCVETNTVTALVARPGRGGVRAPGAQGAGRGGSRRLR